MSKGGYESGDGPLPDAESLPTGPAPGAQRATTTAATVYGVVCPTGEVNLTDPDARIAWHHAERANDDCPCGGRANSHVVRRMRDGVDLV